MINNYINKRYDRWLDYAKYHCEKAGIPDEAGDVLNEVLCMLLDKDKAYLDNLYNSIKGEYREIDYYILRMIRLNIQSPTSPYQWKYKQIPIDDKVEFQSMEIEDKDDDSTPCEEVTLDRVNKVRCIFDQLVLHKLEKDIFIHHFFCNEKISEWPGAESKNILYTSYRSVRNAIATIVRIEEKKGECDLSHININGIRRREGEIVENYLLKKSHFNIFVKINN